MILFTQLGTFVCENTDVPQTGNAVDGVCPNVVQGWAATENDKKNIAANSNKAKFVFIV